MAGSDSRLDSVPAAELKHRLRRADRRHRLQATALVLPLFAFLIVTFVAPIGLLLLRSVDNSEIAQALPRTVAALRGWDGQGLPAEAAFATMAGELRRAREDGTLAFAAKRLNYEVVGYRSLLFNTSRKLTVEAPASWRELLIGLDARWGETYTWTVLKRGTWAYTPFYVLAALDRRLNEQGQTIVLPEGQALYVGVFARTFWMAAVVTGWCLLLGYPVAFLLAGQPPRTRNLLMILVLLPFWTSLLVRTAAWVVLLQKEGPVNSLLLWLGLVDQPVQLVFNRFGVYVAMVHILLPYMVLPVYSVMSGISPTHLRAAASLGANPLVAFVRVYLPQTLPGVGAGSLLVFILAIGYYITPALLGGPQDQMISYFVAYFTNTTINWGMAAALGSVLLLATLALYAVYARLVGIDKIRLG
jgi:putative spermidine/putrescine transport system permease protein